jgi:hypothetical protein
MPWTRNEIRPRQTMKKCPEEGMKWAQGSNEKSPGEEMKNALERE